jgi:O-antigen/teichoic acid export membrane protein
MSDVARRAVDLTRRIRDRLDPLWWYSLLVFAASRVTDLLNLYFGLFYLPDALSNNELGTVDPINRLVGFGAIPLTVVGVVAAKYLSVYHAKREFGKIRRFMIDMSRLALLAAVVSVAVLVIAFEPLRERLRLESPYLLLGLSGLMVLSCWLPLINVVLQGMQRFYASMAIGPVNALAKLILCCLLVPVLGLSGYLFAMTVAGLITIATGLWTLRKDLGGDVEIVSYRQDMRGILAFAWPVAVWTTCTNLQGFVEPFTVKHFLPDDAAGYYMLCRFGYIPTYLVGALSFVLFPMLSHRHERGEDTQPYLRQAVGVTVVICVCGVALMGLSTGWLMGLRPQWAAYQQYAPQVWLVGTMVTLDAVNAIYITHEVACRRFSFLRALAPAILVECLVLYGAFGWAAFQDMLPACVWGLVRDAVPLTLWFALWAMLVARLIITLLLMCGWRKALRRS